MMKKIPLVFALFVSLSACTAIPLKTLYKLSTLDPMTMNPKLIRMAVRIPDNLKEGKKGVVMSLGSWKEGDEKHPLELKLEKLENNKVLRVHEKKGYTLSIYKLADKDIKVIEDFRHQHKKDKKKYGSKMKGSFGISAHSCRTEKILDKPILVSNWLKIDNTSGFLPTIIDYDIKKEIEDEKWDINKVLPLCSNEA